MSTETTPTTRRRRADGERSRRAILLASARLASVEGLEGLTIGRLARDTGMSKSGLFAHFGSKEELQLATIGVADEIFQEEVLRPAMDVEGLRRVEMICEGFLSHVGRKVFPGGCFFASAAAEVNARPGRVRDRVVAFFGEWTALMDDALLVAQERGEIGPSVDRVQLAFELRAMLNQANGAFMMSDDPVYFDRARRAIAERLERAKA